MNRLATLAESCCSKELKSLCEAAGRAALTAGDIICQLYEQPHKITMKGAIDLVTEADIASETAIIASLNKDVPGINIMAEESRTNPTDTKEGKLWVIDPLDGTTNFAHGVPIFAVSIALLENEQPQIGVIYCPMQDELFCSVLGGGAWLNGKPIEVTDTIFLRQSLVATGFPYDIDKNIADVTHQVATILPKVRDLRRLGAAAVDLAYVACGRLDAFWELDLKPWDTAAGCLLVREAGGRVSDFMGQSYSPFNNKILASNGKLHPLMLELLS